MNTKLFSHQKQKLISNFVYKLNQLLLSEIMISKQQMIQQN